MVIRTVTRVLALDVRPRKIGYAVFESPSRLLNWGVKLIPLPERTDSVISDLLATSRPSGVLMRNDAAEARKNARPQAKHTVRAIKNALKRSLVPVALVSEKHTKTFFHEYGAKTKHEIATTLAKAFPDLAWQLPDPRRPWETEHWHMPIFDAAALGIVHLGMRIDPEAIARLLSR